MRAPLLFLLAAAAALLPALAACGGKVVVDAATVGQGGAGGAGGAGGGAVVGSSSIDVGPSPPPGCADFPSPDGALIDCGSAASSGTGSPILCSTVRCDQGKNLYDADCTGTACECTYHPADGGPVLGCSCILQSTCTINGPDCCPIHL
jgi:hypothetical protein